MQTHPVVHWTEGGEARSARWRSERGAPPPKRVVIADDTMTADDAYGLACQGTALLWQGDFQNARQMLIALASRADRQSRRPKKSNTSPVPTPAASPVPMLPVEAFNLHRQARSQRARTLGMLVLELDENYDLAIATRARRRGRPARKSTAREQVARSSRCASCWV